LIKSVLISILFCAFILIGCSSNDQQNILNIEIVDKGTSNQVSISSGSSVKQTLEIAAIQLNVLDKTEPLINSILTENTTIRITRVREDFTFVESVLPFEQQTVKNESLAEGQSLLIQAGENGSLKKTYRIIYENDVETSRTLVNSEVVQASKPEILMIGVHSPFTIQPIAGVLAYISSSNAWIMENNSGNRRPLVTTGDLDGRIFAVSPDRQWLIYSRSIQTEDSPDINSLWIINLKTENAVPIDIQVKNVVHYASWVPGKTRTLTYSTVEPRSTPPGWQANNDLFLIRFDVDGKTLEKKKVVEANSGGLYGWWGSTFEWSPDGSSLAYARPDSIGLVDMTNGTLSPLVELTPYQTQSNWAWVPNIKWSENNNILFTVLFSQKSSENNGSSPTLSAILVPEKQIINLIPNCGLFCSSFPSSISIDGRFSVTYLSAILPDQSETSRYNLIIMDRDGSNQRKLFPGEGVQGLTPQSLYWSPDFLEKGNSLLAFLSQGDLLLLDTDTGSTKYLTNDGSISKIDWK
jgi:hypothetical protein